MPVSEEKMRDGGRLNVWFSVSAILLLVTTFWFAWKDHHKAWRQYQNHFFDMQATLAHLDYIQTQSDDFQAKLEAIRARVAEAQAEVAARAEELDELNRELKRTEFELAEVKVRHNNANSVLGVTRDTYERTLTAHGTEDARTAAARRKVDEEAEQVDALRLKREQLEDAQREIQGKIKAIRLPLVNAQRELDEQEKPLLAARKKEELYGSRFLQTVLNAPMIDFLAPKGTPNRQEIRQLVLPEVRQQLNYLETYTTDRCTTCHVAIDNREFTREALTAKLEESLPAINEELARMNRVPIEPPDPPTLSARVHNEELPKIRPGRVADHWKLLTSEQKRAYYEALLERVNPYLTLIGRKPIEIGGAVFGHPDLDLYVTVDSPHPMQRMGCTVCHQGNPQETDFVLAAHMPANHEQEHEWAEKYYERSLGVPATTFLVMEHYWDRPMLPLKYTEASCVKCHQEVADLGHFELDPVARRINLGRDLFTRMGCINCHLVNGLDDAVRVGPDLTYVSSKLQRGFTEQWVWNPRSFRPTTKMPHFFMQENNGPGSENEYDPDPVLRTETEVKAIAHYLYEMSERWEPEAIPEGLTGDAARGRELFQTVGCLGCHGNLAEYGEAWLTENMVKRGGKTPAQAKADYDAMTYNDRALYAWEHLASDRDTVFYPDAIRFVPGADYNTPVFTRVAPELSTIGSKVSREWLYGWLRNPHAYSEKTRMPSLRLTEQEALDVAEYLISLKHDTFKATEIPADKPHQEMADKLVFEILAAQRSERRSAAIMNDEGGALTQMLVAGMAGAENEQAARQRIEAMDTPSKRWLFLGSKMIAHYGCYACHKIAGFETATRPGTELTNWAAKPIAQLDFAFFGHGTEEMREKNHEVFGHLYPPLRPDLLRLAHQVNPEVDITHTHATFGYYKMRNPRIWDRMKIKKPYDKLKMPNFYFTEEEAEALVTYLLGRRPPLVRETLVVGNGSRHESIAAGRNLTRELNCIGCHQIEDNVATVAQFYRTKVGGVEYFDEVNAPPNLRGEGAKVIPTWFFGFLHNVEMLRPWLKIRMPSFQLTHEEATTLVEYFAGLSNHEAGDLQKRLRPVHEFLVAQKAAAEPQFGGGDGEEKSPNDYWFNQRLLRPAADYLARYAVQNRLATRFDVDRNELGAEELDSGMTKVLERTDFLRNLYNVPYPFMDAPRSLVSEERFHLGQDLMLELGCLKCHVFGDPNVEGSNPNPSAPNLNLTFRRLRQDWVRAWLKGPGYIQPGTKMPGLWPGMRSAFADYGDTAAELEAKYGETAAEQIELLLDFMYNAGLTNHTVIQPGLAEQLKAAPQEAGEEFDEDEGESEEFVEDDE